MSSYKIKKIYTLAELIGELEKDYEDYGGSIWYRGQTKESHSLLPSYLRKEYSTEQTILSAFKQNATMLTNAQPNNSFDWMFLMQHYGIPTRLLDWSESPLVALYFALQKNDNNDAVLWALKPTELNKHCGIDEEKEEFFIPSFESKVIAGYSIESISDTPAKLNPSAVIATRNNPRIQAQMGVFTIHHKNKIPIEDIGDKSHILKYIIDKDSKVQILKQIELLGITKFQLFPELSSIESMMKKRGLIK
ncbi:FRG domain-containing protein [Aliarcobacter cryaerophilus]|uniref:FRG domain-containing protein n=1 Tax=Aliarcobacter cryaerophilus TaxID=28198 RepID=A0A2S9TMI6_9BACT|nr:FRG domain-containing protein [Aliarcobacter cryaerophilus]PRN00067.1 FRG domain-containing protein [Arcobacter cryaerophilus gv. pseudocryaerophilus]